MIPLSMPSTFPLERGEFQIKKKLEFTTVDSIAASEPIKVDSYEQLTDLVSKLAFANRRYVLFFRGQPKEYCLGNKVPTIYPSLFRKHISKGHSLEELFSHLDNAQEELKKKNHNRNPRFAGSSSIMGRFHVRWALLQHYENCDTPLIDVTQSLHIAASFALKDSDQSELKTGIIYVLALPWPSKNYHQDKEEDLYIVRLAGITPPQAKRPYRQEAFAVMSHDLATKKIREFDLKRLDFANRLVCKFEINNSPEFWGDVTKPLPQTFLAPKDDIFYNFMKALKTSPNV